MTGPTLRVRRATVEDLDTLRTLWKSMHLTVSDLEPRLTEFQIVEDPKGKVLGGIGLDIAGSQGRLHSEAFGDFAAADDARELLWKRIQTLATNHGVLRLWTREKASFWWLRLGFKSPDDAELKKIPANWNPEQPGWLTLQLKNEDAINAAEREMTLFMSAQRKNAERTVQSMKTFKNLATFIAILIAFAAFAAAFYLLIKRAGLIHQ